MRPTFEFSAPTRVSFGVERSSQLPEFMRGYRWGLLSTGHMQQRSRIAESLRRCGEEGIDVVHLGLVTPNPRLREVEAALAAAESAHITGIVAIGGGSVMDAGKVLALAYRHGVTAASVASDLRSVVQKNQVRTCELLVVPTTAGTGAEVSHGAILTDDVGRRKLAVRGSALVPNAVLIDPALALTLPPRRTAETGFDVIAHAVETYLSLAATPVTDVLALAALEAVPAALIRAVDDGADLDARTTLALHAWLMGYNLAHSSTCLPHRMQYPVGAVTDTSHQIGLAALYPAWIRAVNIRAPDRMKRVVDRVMMSLASVRSFVGDAPEAHELFRAFLYRLGIGATLSDLGITRTQVDQLTVSVEGRTDLDPMLPTPGDIRGLFVESLGR